MRKLTASLLAGALALSAAAPAFADPPRYNDNGRYNNDRYNDRDYRDGRWDNRRDNDWRRYNGNGWYDNRGKHHKWNRGDRFDRYSYNRFVVVNDYRNYRDHRGYRLPPPRYGERYYRNNDTGEILLIAAATGLVLWALNN
jgi:Ni/Co efflux regulator RcnB